MKRREFLKAVTVTVAAGTVMRSFAQDAAIGDGPEFEPWRTWNQDSQRGPLALVRAAIISANAYNTQPWLFHVSDSRIQIFADTKRNLGAFDPYLREMHFSLGCALENLALAAAANGYTPKTEYVAAPLAPPVPNAKPELAIRVNLIRAAKQPSELYDAIPRRHTNRNPFDPHKPLPEDFANTLSAIPHDLYGAADRDVRLFTFSGAELIGKVAEAVAGASTELLSDPDVRRGTQPWVRTTREQQRQLRDGSFVDSKNASGSNPNAYRDLMKTASLFGLIAVRDRYDRAQTVRAGRVWQRAHLLATARGIGGRPANGSVELIDHQRQTNQPPKSAEALAQFTGDASWQPTFMFYMGYATAPAPASPRRPIESLQISDEPA